MSTDTKDKLGLLIDRFFSNIDIVVCVFVIAIITGYLLGYNEGVNYEPTKECTSEYVAIAGEEDCERIMRNADEEYLESLELRY
jgi:hypothetical protein